MALNFYPPPSTTLTLPATPPQFAGTSSVPGAPGYLLFSGPYGTIGRISGANLATVLGISGTSGGGGGGDAFLANNQTFTGNNLFSGEFEVHHAAGDEGGIVSKSSVNNHALVLTAQGIGMLAVTRYNGVLIDGIDSFLGFAAGNLVVSRTADVAIGRAAAGVIEVNNGTAGTLAEIRARGLPFVIKVANVDLKVVQVIDVYTVPSGFFILEDAWIFGVNISVLSAGATFQIQESGSAQVMATAVQTPTMLVSHAQVFPRPNASRPTVAPGGKVQFNNTAAATATTDIVDLYVKGWIRY